MLENMKELELDDEQLDAVVGGYNVGDVVNCEIGRAHV